MAEEKYIQDITNLFSISGHGLASILSVLAVAANPTDKLVDHLRHGGEVCSDVQIPRSYMAHFEQECKEKNLDFVFLNGEDSQSEFVTVMYAGPEGYERNEDGEFVKDLNGKRIPTGKGAENVVALRDIANELREKYLAEKREFTQDLDPTAPMVIAGRVMNLDNLSLAEAYILQERFSQNCVRSNILEIESGNKKSYSVEVSAEDFNRVSDKYLSPAEKAVREALMISCDPVVRDYISAQKELDTKLIDLVERGSHELNGLTLHESQNLHIKDPMGQNDKSYYEINFSEKDKDMWAEVKITDTLTGITRSTRLNLSLENDKLTLFNYAASMESKTLESTKAYRERYKEFYQFMLHRDDEKYKKIWESIRDPYYLDHKKESLNHTALEIARTGISLEDAKNSPDYDIQAMYKTYMEIEHDINQTKYLCESCFSKEDLAFSEYSRAITSDANVAVGSVGNKPGENMLESKVPITEQLGIPDTHEVLDLTAMYTDNMDKKDIVAKVDKDRVELLRENMQTRLAGKEIVIHDAKGRAGRVLPMVGALGIALRDKRADFNHLSQSVRDNIKLREVPEPTAEEIDAFARDNDIDIEDFENEQIYSYKARVKEELDVDHDGVVEDQEADPTNVNYDDFFEDRDEDGFENDEEEYDRRR